MKKVYWNQNLLSLKEIAELRKKLEISEALLAKLENRPLEPTLIDHSFLSYGYGCNDVSKFGNSFVNING